MKRSSKKAAWLAGAWVVMGVLATGGALVNAGQGQGHGQHEHHDADKPTTLTGEVVDLMCYLDHGARGKDHQDCAKRCIASGGPVGLLVQETSDGHGHEHMHDDHDDDDGHEGHPQVFLIIGNHKPLNSKLADHAAKQITVVGKVVNRAGMKMIENVQIVSVGELAE